MFLRDMNWFHYSADNTRFDLATYVGSRMQNKIIIIHTINKENWVYELPNIQLICFYLKNKFRFKWNTNHLPGFRGYQYFTNRPREFIVFSVSKNFLILGSKRSSPGENVQNFQNRRAASHQNQTRYCYKCDV